MSLDDTQIHLVDDFDTARRCMEWISTAPSLALDTESEGLDLHRDKVRLFQLGDSFQSFVFPIEGPRSWGGLAIELLEKYPGKIIGHHLKFDANGIRRWMGVELDLTRVACTMLMARVINPTRSAALKNLAANLVDPRARVMDRELGDAMKASGYDWRTVPLGFDRYWFYAGVDTILTHRVHDILEPQLDELGVRRAYDLELVSGFVCGAMEMHGAKVDMNYTRRAYEQLNSYVDQVARWTESEYGVKPGANAAVVAVLEEAGFTFSKSTAMGAKSLDKEVLGGIDHPLARAVLQRRQAQKLASTYLKHFIYEADESDRIHPRINTCEARTSRMSMDSPNLQNLPRRDDKNPLAAIIRNCIVPAEGNILMMCDFDQIEWRLFASLSNDEKLMDAFVGDTDFFTIICRQVFNDESIQKSDPRRQITKNAMYARIYGAGTEKFAWTAGITVSDAKQFTTLLDHRYPAIRRLQQQIDAGARQHLSTGGVAYVTSPLTGRRFMIDDDATYKLVNYLFQGTAAEVLKMKLIQLSEAGLEKYLVCPVHDEVIMEVPRERADEIGHSVLEVMNDTKLFPVAISASLSIGDRWGEKRDYNPVGG